VGDVVHVKDGAARLSMGGRQGGDQIGGWTIDGCDRIKPPHRDHAVAIEPDAHFLAGGNRRARAHVRRVGSRRCFRLLCKQRWRTELNPPPIEALVEGAGGSAYEIDAHGQLSAKSGKEEDVEDGEPTGNTKLLVRLYFSGHEKLTYQRWIDRIPTEEPFKVAAPEIIHLGDAAFDEANNRFENLD